MKDLLGNILPQYNKFIIYNDDANSKTITQTPTTQTPYMTTSYISF